MAAPISASSERFHEAAVVTGIGKTVLPRTCRTAVGRGFKHASAIQVRSYSAIQVLS